MAGTQYGSGDGSGDDSGSSGSSGNMCCWLCVLLRGVVPNRPGPFLLKLFLMIKYNPKHTALMDDKARAGKNSTQNNNLYIFIFSCAMYLLIYLI